MMHETNTYGYHQPGNHAHDKHTTTDPWTTSGSEEPYGDYGDPEPEAVDVYRDMLNSPGIDDDQAEFLETRINDLLER